MILQITLFGYTQQKIKRPTEKSKTKHNHKDESMFALRRKRFSLFFVKTAKNLP